MRLATGDITGAIAASVDVIVNAANSGLLGGGGVDGAIHRAGGPEILAECRALRAEAYRDGLPAGQAVATTAGRLPCRWVVHTVGPVFDPRRDQSAILRSCYSTSLDVAAGLGARSVAFPLISAGVYRWPKDDAIRQADAAVAGFAAAADQPIEVTMVLFDRPTLDLAVQLLRT